MTGLIEIPRPCNNEGRPIDIPTLRRAFWANAVSVEGLIATKEHLETWHELLGEPAKNSWWDLDGRDGTVVWTCGLVAEGIWRRMGVDLDKLYEPYVIGMAISRAVWFASKCGAWKTPKSGHRPREGDYVVVMTPFEHALTMTDWKETPDGPRLESVDGGQTEKGFQAIKRVERPWIDKGHVVYLGSRLLGGWADVSRLKYRGQTCLVPAGWET